MAWVQAADLTGAQGPEGPVGPQGPAGAQGPQGVAGEGIAIAGSVATYANLPGGLGAGDAGDGYLVEADGLLYIWSGTSFPADGNGVAFQGPAGPAGPQGPEGPDGPQGAQGIQGPVGPQGNPGARGTQIFSGVGAPGVIGGSAAGDFYIDTTPGAVVLYKLA